MPKRTVGFLLLLLVFLAAASAIWIRNELDFPYYGAPSPETFVEIPKGSTSRAIADLLADAGVLKYRLPFTVYLRWTGYGKRLQAGEYRFFEPSTPKQVVERMMRGDVYFNSITIPEGLTALETVELIARAGMGSMPEMERCLARTEFIRDLDPNARSLEGYLFPDTYRFARKADSEQIIRTMVSQFREKMRRLRSEYGIREGWKIGEIVNLASLIEKEVKSREERPLVASVFANRLEKGMPLACDPTVIYALKMVGKYDGNIRKGDLILESPYNTYIHAGLPPGPIANPGEDSLRAALRPAKSDFLYFVSRNDGTHEFSRDFRTHQSAVNRFQKHPGR